MAGFLNVRFLIKPLEGRHTNLSYLTIMWYDTPTLENAYSKFGDSIKVNNWKNLYIGLKPVVKGKVVKIKNKRPFWYEKVITPVNMRLKRLQMTEDISYAIITRSGKAVSNELASMKEVEVLARKSVHDWRIEFFTAFESLVYQRQGRSKWMLIEIGKGYA